MIVASCRGYIDVAELELLLLALGRDGSKEEVNTVMRGLELDAKDKVELSAFTEWWINNGSQFVSKK